MQKEYSSQLDLMHNLSKTFKMLAMSIRLEMEKRGIDLTKEQGMMLRRLMEEDGLIQNELAGLSDRDKTSLARLLGKMESGGWIVRRTDSDDRRAKRVYLTPKGRKKALVIRGIIDELAAQFFRGMEKDEMDQAHAWLNKIQKNLDYDFKI